MFDFNQSLREFTLENIGKTPQEKADALNLVEAIISQEFTVEQLVKKIAKGKVPVIYKVID